LDQREAFSALALLQLPGLWVALVVAAVGLPMVLLDEEGVVVGLWELEQQQLEVQQGQLLVVEEEVEQLLQVQEPLQLGPQLVWRRQDPAES
jgi:hypothetical protein